MHVPLCLAISALKLLPWPRVSRVVLCGLGSSGRWAALYASSSSPCSLHSSSFLRLAVLRLGKSDYDNWPLEDQKIRYAAPYSSHLWVREVHVFFLHICFASHSHSFHLSLRHSFPICPGHMNCVSNWSSSRRLEKQTCFYSSDMVSIRHISIRHTKRCLHKSSQQGWAKVMSIWEQR